MIRSDRFEQLFVQWVESLTSKDFDNVSFKEVIAIDGKTLKWKKLTSTREIKNAITEETRWYISSLNVNSEQMNTCIRQHWQLENCLHWALDVTFREDYHRK
jgi:predicted transposase YbfD/YdcC